MTPSFRHGRTAAALLAAAAAVSSLSGCAPLLIGGAAVGGVLVATDRRTSGTQVEDQGIELKAGARLREAFGDRGHFSVNAFNRVALITGEAASDADRQRAEQIVAQVENVKSVVNELAVAGASSLTARSNDLILASKVKATFVDAKDVQANAIKVTVERSIVYLQGVVSEREAARATELSRSVSGVARVVRVFEIVSEDELARRRPAASTTSTPAR